MRIFPTDTTGIHTAELTQHLDRLRPYVATTLHAAAGDTEYRSPEAVLATPGDDRIEADVRALVTRVGAPRELVLLVGIGGSDLGARAVYDAVVGRLERTHQERAPQLHVFDTIEPRVTDRVQALLLDYAPEDILLIVVSKSGGTVETVANANTLFRMLVEQYGAERAAARTVIVSDAAAPLATRAQAQGIMHAALPAQVGGRFSVFTAAGIVPLAFLGLDVGALRAGARDAIAASTKETGVSGAALRAAILYESYRRGLDIQELFVFAPELERVGKWQRQLYAESLGKAAADGSLVGLTPTVAVGSTDMHSLGQLVFGGARRRFTTFLAVPNTWLGSMSLSDTSPFSLDLMAGKRLGDVSRALYEGVYAAYRNAHLPFMRIELEAMSERELGAYLGYELVTVLCFAELLSVNAFDQPAVESYKVEMRRALEYHGV